MLSKVRYRRINTSRRLKINLKIKPTRDCRGLISPIIHKLRFTEIRLLNDSNGLQPIYCDIQIEDGDVFNLRLFSLIIY